MINRCPGQDKRKIKADVLTCRTCGSGVEIFSDEFKAKCPKCQSLLSREVLPSCIEWCRYAKDCVGTGVYDAYMKDKSLVIKEKLIKELEAYFATDTKRIQHAKQVMEYAEELLRRDGGDWHIVIPASLLHDVGIKAAEEKYGSTAGHYQEKEGPAMARGILLKVGLKKEDADQICEIIAHHHSPGKMQTLNFQLLYDADWLVNLQDEADSADKARLEAKIEKVFLTPAGREMARKIYLEREGA